MDTNDYLVSFILLVFILFGLWNIIGAPLVAKQFYKTNNFLNQGKSSLDRPEESDLLYPLATSRLHSGSQSGYKLDHCKAYPKNRRQFTLSKAKRKFNQSRWAITRLKSPTKLPEFCLLPASEPQTIFLMMEDPGVDLSADKELVNRYHLRSDHPERIINLLQTNVRDTLMAKELISLECIDNVLILKRAWPVEKIKQRLAADLTFAVEVATNLERTNPES